MTSKPNEPFAFDPLESFMSNFRHLLCANPDFQFSEPPDPTVREAQDRSIYDFFISYRHGWSQTYAQRVTTELREFGYRVYFADVVFEIPEEVLRTELESAMHQSSVLVVIGNKDMMEGEWVEWEMETFHADHWGRKVPIITEEMGSPISGDYNRSDVWLKTLRRIDPSAAIIYEEDQGAWTEQMPSATTLFCLLLVRECYRVELDWWHKWTPMEPEARYRSYLTAMYEDRVCRTIMHAMNWPHRDYSLGKLKSGYLKEAREDKPGKIEWLFTFIQTPTMRKLTAPIMVIPYILLFLVCRYGFGRIEPLYLKAGCLLSPATDHPIDVQVMAAKRFFDAAYVRTEGRDCYNVSGYFHTFFPLDMLFPVIYTLLFLTCLRLCTLARNLPFFTVLIFAGMVFDYFEDFGFALFLTTDKNIFTYTTAIFTTLKSLCFPLNLLFSAFWLLWFGWCRLTKRAC